jgi:hypothetical protein
VNLYSEHLITSGSVQSYRDDDGMWWVGAPNRADDAFDAETRNGQTGLALWWDQYWYADER